EQVEEVELARALLQGLVLVDDAPELDEEGRGEIGVARVERRVELGAPGAASIQHLLARQPLAATVPVAGALPPPASAPLEPPELRLDGVVVACLDLFAAVDLVDRAADLDEGLGQPALREALRGELRHFAER